MTKQRLVPLCQAGALILKHVNHKRSHTAAEMEEDAPPSPAKRAGAASPAQRTQSPSLASQATSGLYHSTENTGCSSASRCTAALTLEQVQRGAEAAVANGTLEPQKSARAPKRLSGASLGRDPPPKRHAPAAGIAPSLVAEVVDLCSSDED